MTGRKGETRKISQDESSRNLSGFGLKFNISETKLLY